MASKKKQELELRFYEVPQGEFILPLIGPDWIRDYGNDTSGLHFHNLMEIGYCIDGEGEMVMNGIVIPYSPGMLTVIPKNYPHTTISRPNTKSYWEYLFLEPKMILEDMYPNQRMFARKIEKLVSDGEQHYIKGENEDMAGIVRVILEECRYRKRYSGECIKGLLLSLMMAIARQGNIQELIQENEGKTSQQHAGIYHISNALDCIGKRYMENIKMRTLADSCNLSETHFRRLFVEYMNMTPVEYINLMRVQQACELMQKTPYSMEELAAKVGYTAVSTFNRNFKKIVGTSPYQYKKNRGNYQGKLLNVNVSAKKGW